MNTTQSLPIPKGVPLVGGDRNITDAWYAFLRTMWLRTGSGQGIDGGNTSDLATIGGVYDDDVTPADPTEALVFETPADAAESAAPAMDDADPAPDTLGPGLALESPAEPQSDQVAQALALGDAPGAADTGLGLVLALESPADPSVTPWVAAPVHDNSPGVAGQVAYDSGFFYVCTAANTWARVALGGTW